MSDIKVICTSDKNVAVSFTWNGFTPFHLVDIEGIYGIESNVVTSENTTIDGSTYQGATAKERYVNLIVEMDSNYSENRNLLYKCFPIKSSGTMEYIEDGEIKVIKYEVESIIPGKTTGVVRDYTLSLICPDPYFKDPIDTEIIMASWVSDFFFPAEFPAEGIEFGHRKTEYVKVIENTNGADNTGITVVFKAGGTVKNPAIYHTESGEFFKVGFEGNDLFLESGQYVIICTHTGKKDVYLIDKAHQAEIEDVRNRYGLIDWERVVDQYGQSINEYMDEDGTFIQLQYGTNTLTYSAEEGINFLSVSIYYRVSYLGV
ncbi:MAG: phage tail family protein [Acetatifactor sp.]|nr:phage tail family protein [Acetatifactor sp.]